MYMLNKSLTIEKSKRIHVHIHIYIYSQQEKLRGGQNGLVTLCSNSSFLFNSKSSEFRCLGQGRALHGVQNCRGNKCN